MISRRTKQRTTIPGIRNEWWSLGAPKAEVWRSHSKQCTEPSKEDSVRTRAPPYTRPKVGLAPKFGESKERGNVSLLTVII